MLFTHTHTHTHTRCPQDRSVVISAISSPTLCLEGKKRGSRAGDGDKLGFGFFSLKYSAHATHRCPLILLIPECYRRSRTTEQALAVDSTPAQHTRADCSSAARVSRVWSRSDLVVWSSWSSSEFGAGRVGAAPHLIITPHLQCCRCHQTLSASARLAAAPADCRLTDCGWMPLIPRCYTESPSTPLHSTPCPLQLVRLVQGPESPGLLRFYQTKALPDLWLPTYFVIVVKVLL